MFQEEGTANVKALSKRHVGNEYGGQYAWSEEEIGKTFQVSEVVIRKGVKVKKAELHNQQSKETAKSAVCQQHKA